jgi:hypothetical protein
MIVKRALFDGEISRWEEGERRGLMGKWILKKYSIIKTTKTYFKRRDG